MRRESLPEPSDRLWQEVEGWVGDLDRTRDELLAAASWYWHEPTPYFLRGFEVWRLVSGVKFNELIQRSACLEFPNFEKARLITGLFEREDELRVSGINVIADEVICYPIKHETFIEKKLSKIVSRQGWPKVLTQISEENQRNMDNDFIKLLNHR